jgi:hypothetical protein
VLIFLIVVHSPVEECMDRVPDVLTSSSIQGPVLRGRNEGMLPPFGIVLVVLITILFLIVQPFLKLK